MKGIDMMLKAFGIDPEEMMGQFRVGLKALVDSVSEVKGKAELIDRRLERIERALKIPELKVIDNGRSESERRKDSVS